MWYWLVGFGLAIWIAVDGSSRKFNFLPYALATILLWPLVSPIYLASRPLKAGERRRVGAVWNVAKYLAVTWTVCLAVPFFRAVRELNHPRRTDLDFGQALDKVFGLFVE